MNIQSYIHLFRLDKPVGFLLLALPCWWGLTLSHAPIQLYIWFTLGAFFMRTAGCIINDIWDRHIDKHVERTQGRPITSGKISVSWAIFWFMILSMCGGGIWILLSFWTKIISLLFFVIACLYPLCKRFFDWPQLVLGICFNSGALLAYFETTGHLSKNILFIYVGGIFWTLAYDTIYALQDKKDDIKIGVKSSAITLGSHVNKAILGFYIASVLCFSCVNIHTLYAFFIIPYVLLRFERNYWYGVMILILIRF
jgi:4-hydroxybenzoate polyprenyltransferase